MIDKETVVGRFSDWMMRRDDDDSDEMTNFDRDFGHNYAPETRPTEVNKPPKRPERTSIFKKPSRRLEPETVSVLGEEGNSQNVVVYTPKTYEDVQTLIDYLKRREPVVVDLSGINSDSAQRILDFMSGAIYGLSGSIHRINGNIFLLTPAGVSIMVPKNIGTDK